MKSEQNVIKNFSKEALSLQEQLVQIKPLLVIKYDEKAPKDSKVNLSLENSDPDKTKSGLVNVECNDSADNYQLCKSKNCESLTVKGSIVSTLNNQQEKGAYHNVDHDLLQDDTKHKNTFSHYLVSKYCKHHDSFIHRSVNQNALGYPFHIKENALACGFEAVKSDTGYDDGYCYIKNGLKWIFTLSGLKRYLKAQYGISECTDEILEKEFGYDVKTYRNIEKYGIDYNPNIEEENLYQELGSDDLVDGALYLGDHMYLLPNGDVIDESERPFKELGF